MLELVGPRARLIAFYLPQFHPIPENDKWWGKGFTEWTNVVKAKPLFPGHHQPNLPADVGFYDLRVPETRMAQAELARGHGIEGFCYWHYWFAGKRLLERPFNEVLRTGEPDFPFCLAWANQTWTGAWHGAPNRILIEQTYPGMADYNSHFWSVFPAFIDERYLRIDGRPLFAVFNPSSLPDPVQFTDCWRELALRAGLKGLYLAGISHPHWNPKANGFDATIVDNPGYVFTRLGHFRQSLLDGYSQRLFGRPWRELGRSLIRRPAIYSYSRAIQLALPSPNHDHDEYPCVVPGWDNTPRSGCRGVVLRGSTPELYRAYLRSAIKLVSPQVPQKRVVFIKSWNEWAEGNYLEPDQQYGTAYLEVTKREASLKQDGDSEQK